MSLRRFAGGRKIHPKKVVFALIPLLLLFLGSSAALYVLERLGTISTLRLDDRASNPPLTLLEVVSGPLGAKDFHIKTPGMIEIRFPVRKEEGVFRLVLAGASFIKGCPYVMNETRNDPDIPGPIPKWVQAELEMRFPSRQFEVINAGCEGANTRLVRSIVEDLCRASPDAIVVATGNNEGFVPATPFNEALHKWIVYRAMKKALLPQIKREDRPPFFPQDADTLKIEENFKEDVLAFIRFARTSQTKLILTTFPINLRYNSKEIHPRRGMPFPADDPFFQAGTRLEREGQFDEAIAEYSKSPNQAHAARLVARCLEAMGRYEDAKRLYMVHTQQLPNGRIRPSYNDFIRSLGPSEGVPILDLAEFLEDRSSTGIPDANLFTDSCHMKWQGYRLIAHEIVRYLIDSGLIRGRPGEPLPEPSTDEMIKKYRWESLYNDPRAKVDSAAM